MDTRPDVNSAQAVLDGSISDSTFQRVYRWMVRQVSTTYKEPGLRRTRAWSREAGRQARVGTSAAGQAAACSDGVQPTDLRRGEEVHTSQPPDAPLLSASRALLLSQKQLGKYFGGSLSSTPGSRRQSRQSRK